MKKVKSILAVLAAVLTLCGSLSVSALAAQESEPVSERTAINDDAASGQDSSEDTFEVKLDRYRADGNDLYMFANQNRASFPVITPDDMILMFGNQQMPVKSVSRFGDSGEGVSYLFLVDVSGSLDKARIEKIRGMVKAFADLKSEKDSIAIVRMGNELTSSGFLTDAEAIRQAADEIELTREDTNLYYGIVESLKMLKTTEGLNLKRGLVIFSDGVDDQATGITKEEADKAATDNNIPIFTVAMLKDKPSIKDKEDAKLLGAFARESAGGIHFAPGIDGNTEADVPPAVAKRLADSMILCGDLENIMVYGQKVNIKLTVRNESEEAEDDITIPESDVKIIIAEKEKAAETVEPETVEESESTEETVVEEKKEGFLFGMPLWFFLLVCAAVLLVIVLIILIVWKFSSNSLDEPDDKEGDEKTEMKSASKDYGRTEVAAGQAGGTAALDNGGFTTVPLDQALSTPPSAGGPGINLRLTRIGKGEDKENVYTANFVDTCVIGRSKGKSKIAFPEDKALSGAHCSLIRKNGRMYLKDVKSTNGTFLNGVPVTGEREVQQDDILLIGSYEYRISWKDK